MTLSATLTNIARTTQTLAGALDSVVEFRSVSRALVAEHIRTTIAFSSGGDATEPRPPSTARIKSELRRNLAGLWAGRGASDAETCFEATLRDLARIGDIVDIGSGNWVGTPLRLIDLRSTCFLVAGGLPTSSAGARLKRPVMNSGLARFVDLGRGTRAIEPSPSHAWFGPSEDLFNWTQKILTFYEQSYGRPDDADVNQIEVYSPDIHQRRRSFGRWMPALDAGPDVGGFRLFRPLAAYSRAYDRPYYLGKFVNSASGVLLRTSVKVPYDISLRLRFGLDRFLQVPRIVELTERRSTIEARIPFTLPEPEAKVLGLAWGRDATDGDDRLTFGVELAPLLDFALARLGIFSKVLKGETHGTGLNRS